MLISVSQSEHLCPEQDLNNRYGIHGLRRMIPDDVCDPLILCLKQLNLHDRGALKTNWFPYNVLWIFVVPREFMFLVNPRPFYLLMINWLHILSDVWRTFVHLPFTWAALFSEWCGFKRIMLCPADPCAKKYLLNSGVTAFPTVKLDQQMWSWSPMDWQLSPSGSALITVWSGPSRSSFIALDFITSDRV